MVLSLFFAAINRVLAVLTAERSYSQIAITSERFTLFAVRRVFDVFMNDKERTRARRVRRSFRAAVSA